MVSVKWLEKPEAHDFPAAADYLDLLADPNTVKKLTKTAEGGNRRRTRRPRTFCGQRS